MDLEFSDIQAESQGVLYNGKLTFKADAVVFKSSKNNKTEHVSANDIDVLNWMKVAEKQGIRLINKDGILNRYFGFKESDCDKITKFIKVNYEIDITPKEFSVRGWNWGTANFNGSVLSFDVNNLTAFDLALNNVSQCTTGRNEVTLEFHQNEDAPVSLLEMRFHIPSSDLAGDTDRVEAFQKRVMQQASVVSVSGDAIAIFREVQCLTPRGRYDFTIFNTFFQLHGKTFDYKVPMSTIVKLFLLPAKDGRQQFLVINLDPPIKRGETRYHFVVFSFMQDEESNIELPFTEDDIKNKYDNKITKELSGSTYEVVGKIIRVLINRKITTPGSFRGNSGTAAVSCSFKAAAGYLYPLERGFIYVHKPPVHVRFEEISCVNFARSGGSTRSFDLEVELKSSVIHTFSSIEKEEYANLYNYIVGKKLKVKTKSQGDKPTYVDDGDDDDGDAPDAYLERVKREGKERDDDDDDDESTDEDFDPDAAEDADDVPEEYDSDAVSSDDDDDDEEGGSEGESKPKKSVKDKDKPKSKPKPKKEKSEKREHKKKPKDENRPKRPPSAYMLWFNETRDKIKTDNPGITFAEIGKKGGEMWKALGTSDKEQWDKKAAKAKDKYVEAMKAYVESGGGTKREATGSDQEATSKKKKPKKASSSLSSSAISPVKSGSGSNYLSKEFIEDDSSSESDADKKPSAAKHKENNKPTTSAKPSTEKENASNKKTTTAVVASKKKRDTSSSNDSSSQSDDVSSASDSDDKKKKATPTTKKNVASSSKAVPVSKRKKESDSEEEKIKKKSKQADSDDSEDESSTDDDESDE